MAGLRWVVVALTFVLSAGGGSAAVDQNWLTSIIDGIKKEYALRGAFSLAVSVPQDQDVSDLQQILQDDPADRVTESVSGGDVYRGARVVAAGRSAALSRVLDDVQTLASSSRGGFLVIYSDRSPCDPADPSGLAGKVDVVRRWSGYAFVFSEADRAAGSLQCAAVSKLGLDNIFRCYEPAGDALRCDSCAEGAEGSCAQNQASSAGGEVAGPRSLTGTDDEAASGGEVGGGGGQDDAVASPEGSDRGRKEGKVAKQCKRKGCDKRKKGGVSRKTRKGRRGAARGEPPRGRKGKGGRGGKKRGKGGRMSRSRSKGRSMSRNRSKGKGRSMSRSKGRSMSRSKGRSRSRSKGKGRSMSRSKGRSRSRSKGKGRSMSRSKSKGRSKGRSRSRSRSRSKGRSQGRSRSRSKGKSRSRSRSRSKGRSKRWGWLE